MSDEQAFIKRPIQPHTGSTLQGFTGYPQPASFFFPFNKLPAAFSSKRPASSI
jgi:hypothetical protein